MKSNKTTEILGVRIDLFTINEINNLIIEKAKHPYKEPIVIFKPYVEFLSLASRNSDIKQLLNSSDYNIADSVAVQWASSYLYGEPRTGRGLLLAYWSLLYKMRSKKWSTQIVPERMAGVDQTKPLLKLANKERLKIGIVGGPRDTDRTANELRKRFKNLKVKVWTGYYDLTDENRLVEDISNSNLDILFCAMGFPRQEKFSVKYRDKLNTKVIIGEGGSFDYDQLGGQIKRAPSWMRKAGLEWLWRLFLQPSRMRRQFAIPAFISKVKNEKSHKK